jgi:hypothetical protein
VRTATEIIDGFVERGAVPAAQDLRLMLRELPRVGSRVEHDRLDFKQGFNCTDAAWLDLIRHVAAMANSGGGVLFFGIADDGSRIGLSKSLLDVFDPTKIANRIRKFSSGPQVRISYFEVTYYRKLFGSLWVYAGSRLLVFDKTIQYPGANKVALQQGVIYVRRQTATEPATQADVNAALDRIVNRNVRAFIARIDHVASLPASTELIARPPGANEGYVLTASREGMPVTIVGPKSGASPVKIDETLLPDIPLAGPTHEIANQVRHWRMDSGHRVNPGTLHRWYLSREDLDFSVVRDCAEFAFLSAVDGNDFPMFWASKMEKERLRQIVEHKIALRHYPASLIIPYVEAYSRVSL